MKLLSNISIILIVFMLLGTATTAQAANTQQGLPNPIGASNMTLIDIAIRVLQIALGLVSLIALTMFIWGGLVMLTSGGNPDRVKKAKDTLLWAVLGLAVILLSGAIIGYIQENFQF